MFDEYFKSENTGLSIIIVNYFSENNILFLYRDILRDFEYDRGMEIIIVDNSGSFYSSKSKDLIDDSRVLIVDSPQGNIGFGRAVNIGFEHCQFDKICVINPDIRYEGNVLSSLAKVLDNQDLSVGCVTCALTYVGGSTQISVYDARVPNWAAFFGSVFINNLPSYVRQIFKPKNRSSKIKTLDPLWTGSSGALFIMRSQVFNEIGGFDPDFFMYCEDTELFRRRFAGRFKVKYCDSIFVEHAQGGSDKYGLMAYQNQVSFLLYLRKIGARYLICWIIAVLPKYLILLIISMFYRGAKQYEAIGFFRSWIYLPIIIMRGGGFGNFKDPLKVREIPD